MSVLVYLQPQEDRIHKISIELCALASSWNQEVYAFSPQKLSPFMLEQIGKWKLQKVFVIPCEEIYSLDSISLDLYQCVQKISPDILLIGGTLEGRALAPTVAAVCHTGVTADCTELRIDEKGLLIQKRPAFGGEVMATIETPKGRPQIATVRQGIFRMETEKMKQCNHFQVEIEFLSRETKMKSVLQRDYVVEVISSGDIQNEEAKVIVAVGGGIQSIEELHRIEKICKNKNIPLMCSRALVERGWKTQKDQIGLSGRSIASDLLITVGISGSVQFMAGIQNVKKILSINHNQDASIMMIADIPLCVDLHEMVEDI
ncbi:electron transfer flavoprotein subunit alpha/FixB family protein [Clostridium sp. CS001]|uniref:electron transfer flavoprotein subunit alpha/FixB family protein n=1 Tax=Clostridium sp. CS001 TaxID=2880648 RepID=UPI001CF3EC22|nr:electron transfer flavoprotein subunit alpha/FixB family protein [Clostridium sp. CS001]MCB2289854.1 electron transfer flavoprotein subunit alpha/FixB family protein [Clostridium sp. CS001]